MSAKPEPRPLVTGDLDLLISRSLDGDLPGEEERDLQSLVAADPAARARYEAMAALVGRLEDLPDPETPFAMATRVSAQVEDDTKGLAASLHRFGFYFRPATLGVVGAGIVAVALAYTLKSPPRSSATVAEARGAATKADDGRVTVFLGPDAKGGGAKGADAAPPPAAEAKAAAAPAATASDARALAVPPPARRDAAGTAERSEPVQVAAAESPRAKEEVGFAPERDAPAAPAPAAARRQMADANAAEGVAMQKSAAAETMRSRAAAPQAAGAVRATASVDVVGKAAGAVRLAAPFVVDGLAGPFDGTYRLELDPSGRVSDVARLFGGSGVEPSGLKERLKALSFVPSEAARAAGAVDVRVRLP